MSYGERSSAFLRLLAERVVVFDGATGSNLQRLELTPDDFEGAEGCNELLVRSRPDVVRELHQSFFAVGCHAVETNTFGANRVVLAEYDRADEAFELNRRAAELAREVAADFHSPDRPRFVGGSIGPGTKLPSLGHIGFDELVLAFREQVAGLLAGGADLLLIETCQDILQTRAALLAARREFARLGHGVPVHLSLTMEVSGTMLLGTELGAALAALLPLRPDSLGLNCATGPLEMKQHIQELSRRAPLPIGAMPNAGLPENIGGETVYPLSPEELARWQRSFIEEDGVRLVGGCCGTTPEHLARLVEVADAASPAARAPEPEPALSSLYSPVALEQQPKPLLVGERTNANGSKKFRKLLLAEDFDAMVELARDQERGGAHALDLCTAYVGRDEVRDMTEAVSRFTRQVRLPLVIDTTQPEVLEAALKLSGGRCLVNSINLEDGEERARQVLELCRDFGAAVVALVIDEEGMAREVEHKLQVAHRLVALAAEYGLQPSDVLLDMLTFTVASGDETLRDAALQTVEAIARAQKELPGVGTILGVSNISFGLKPKARHVLNSVFLDMAVQAGLDAAIVDAAKILPLSRIDPETLERAEDLLQNRHRDGADPLFAYIEHFQRMGKGKLSAGPDPAEDHRSLEERLQRKVVDGDRTELDLLLAAAVTRHQPLAIINEILIPAMKVVGDLFGAGKMQLPFVLQSAEVMKAAVGYLEPLMERAEGEEAQSAGILVLATVKGDVHDIGKNLVDILLSNNGYRVLNLGIKVPVEEMIRVWKEEKADAIGMSGLLVKSTVVMKENLEELRRRGHNPPVLLGGAALTRRYVEQDLRGIYGERVHYGKDAFDGLSLMRAVMAGEAGEAAASGGEGKPANLDQALGAGGGFSEAYAFQHEPEGVDPAPDVPEAPFFGSRELQIPLDQLWPLINENVLFRGRWQYRRGKLSAEEFSRVIEEEVRPAYRALQQQMAEEGLIQPRGIYGYWPCRSRGNAVRILDPAGGDLLHELPFPRQLKPPYHCIADFFRPEGAAEPDLFGALVVTVGQGASERAAELFAAHRYRDYLHYHGLSVELAEAAAEWLHRRMREEMGVAENETDDVAALARQAYRGSRYSFGYPACPNLEDQRPLFALLRPERIGVTLSEEAQMEPEQSVSAFVVHHPGAKYFSV